MLYHQIIVVLGVLPRARFDTCYTYFIPLIVEVNLIYSNFALSSVGDGAAAAEQQVQLMTM